MTGKIKRQIVIDVEIDRPFDGVEQERYVLACIESAFDESWFDYLANEEVAPQVITKASARFAQ